MRGCPTRYFVPRRSFLFRVRGMGRKTSLVSEGKRMYNDHMTNVRTPAMRTVVTAGGERIDFEFERKRVANINMRVRGDGSVHVSAPFRVSESTVLRFVSDRAEWVLRNVERARARCADSFVGKGCAPLWGESVPVVFTEGTRASARFSDGVIAVTAPSAEAADRAVSRLLVKVASRELPVIFREAEAKCGGRFGAPADVAVRVMRSRWGSCDRAGRKIRLNALLVTAPRECAEYVCMHELAHFVSGGHDGAFYAALAEVCPRHAELKKELNAAALTRLPRGGEKN